MPTDAKDRARPRQAPAPPKEAAAGEGGATRADEHAGDEREVLRQEVAQLLSRLGSLGLSDVEIRNALGLTDEYFARLKAEARSDAQITKKGLIGLRLRNALRGIAQLVERPVAALPYEDRIEQEIESLTEGDRHVLVTVPPPMELSSERIRRAVVKAVCRGVEFHYYFPSQDGQYQTVELLRRAERKAVEKGEEPVANVQQYLGWLEEIDKNVKYFEQLLEAEMSRLEMQAKLGELVAPGAPAVGTYQSWLDDLVRVARYDWIFLGFNEKLIWITDKRGEHRIRKEILRPTDRNLPIYDPAQEWDSISLLKSDRLLRTLIRASRSTEGTT